jgi:hypothetical protein
VELSVTGWEDINSDSFFVWEINKLDNLPSDIEGEIDFYHPGYERKVGGKPTKGDGKKGEAPDQYDLDDDELSDSDRATMALISDQVSVSFKKPHITNRIPSKTKVVYRLIGDGQKEILNKDTDLSANEKEESGSLQSGAWNNLDDQTDDTHLYIGKFESFFKMVDCLVAKHGFTIVRKESVKLPKVGNGRKHRLLDTQNPRFLAIVELEIKTQFYTLLEVDTSDGAASLSTILLTSSPGWSKVNEKAILHRIMKKRLSWPSDYFREQLGEKTYIGIKHPPSKHAGSLLPEEISPWAQKVANDIKGDA